MVRRFIVRVVALGFLIGLVYVAQIDAHTLNALDQKSGEEVWTFTAGARIDSPPTVEQGRVLFGCADGSVYCLKADDGQLIWRYRVAPLDRRAMAFEQLESLWPVHGSVLIRNNVVWAVAGRSNFLDGGLRLVRLDLESGKMLSEDQQMRLYVDGERVGEGAAPGLLKRDPAQGLEIGDDAGSSVGDYPSPYQFVGIIDEVRLFFTAVDDASVAERYKDGSEMSADPVLVVSFDDGTARDMSTYRNNGTLNGGKIVTGKSGQGVQFSGKSGAGGRKGKKANATAKAGTAGAGEEPRNSLIEPKWTTDVPIYVRAMVMAGFHLYIVGPPDIIDEEATFRKLSEKDTEVQNLLSAQDAAIEGQQGAKLLTVNTETGEIEHTVELDTLPSWDGLAGAQGQLFLTTLDGRVMCFGKK